MSLIAAAQWLTVATIALAVFAFVTAVYAIRAFRKQSDEVSQLRQERLREAQERRRAQAAQVFTCVGDLPVHEGETNRRAAWVYNTSSQPVYSVDIRWGGHLIAFMIVLLPRGENAFPGVGSLFENLDVIEIRFDDAAGRHWYATSRGELHELHELTDLTEPARPRRSRWPWRRWRPLAG